MGEYGVQVRGWTGRVGRAHSGTTSAEGLSGRGDAFQGLNCGRGVAGAKMEVCGGGVGVEFGAVGAGAGL